jgi:hypothetical protein
VLSARGTGLSTNAKLGENFSVKDLFHRGQRGPEAVWAGRGRLHGPCSSPRVPRLFHPGTAGPGHAPSFRFPQPNAQGYKESGHCRGRGPCGRGFRRSGHRHRSTPLMPVTWVTVSCTSATWTWLVEHEEPLLELPDPVLTRPIFRSGPTWQAGGGRGHHPCRTGPVCPRRPCCPWSAEETSACIPTC